MYDTLAFFRGTPDHPGGFDGVAEHIARNGKCFVKKLWYVFLLRVFFPLETAQF